MIMDSADYTPKRQKTMKSVLISDINEGLGEALALECLERGDTVYGIGKRSNPLLQRKMNFYFRAVNLNDTDLIQEYLRDFIDKHHFDLVILNAVTIGELEEFSSTFMDDLRKAISINLLANKQIIDNLDLHAKVDQVAAVGTGMALRPQKGWGAYAISKAAMNTLIKIYAEEKPWTHFSSIDLGIVMTPDLKAVLEKADAEIYPSVSHIKEGTVLGPQYAAKRFLSACESALKKKSGSILSAGTSVAASGEHP